jgi:hypothetical protein
VRHGRFEISATRTALPKTKGRAWAEGGTSEAAAGAIRRTSVAFMRLVPSIVLVEMVFDKVSKA